MKSTSNDPRAQRTRDLLRQSLIDGTTQKSFRNLTIRDITDGAGVNRATFYLHYEDKYDLLRDCANQLLDEIQQHADLSSVFDPTGFNSLDQHRQRMKIILAHVQKHSEFYRAMFRGDGDQLFYNMFRDVASTWIKGQVMRVFEYRNLTLDEDLIDMMVRFQSAGNFDVIGWWLEQDMRIPIDVMADRLAMVTMPPLISLLSGEAVEIRE